MVLEGFVPCWLQPVPSCVCIPPWEYRLEEGEERKTKHALEASYKGPSRKTQNQFICRSQDSKKATDPFSQQGIDQMTVCGTVVREKFCQPLQERSASPTPRYGEPAIHSMQKFTQIAVICQSMMLPQLVRLNTGIGLMIISQKRNRCNVCSINYTC